MSWLGKISDLILSDLKTAIIGRLSSVETKIDRIEVDTSEIKGGLKNLNSRVFKLESATVEIQGMIKRAGGLICQPLEVGPGSPLKLTKYGEELSKKVNAVKFIEDNEAILFSWIDAKNTKTSYDVQVASKKILEENLSNPIMNNFKSFSYNNPLDINIILNVASIILRDKYLGKHPEIK
jgi:hypothetical protein